MYALPRVYMSEPYLSCRELALAGSLLGRIVRRTTLSKIGQKQAISKKLRSAAVGVRSAGLGIDWFARQVNGRTQP
jgi:hypothetical protein